MKVEVKSPTFFRLIVEKRGVFFPSVHLRGFFFDGDRWNEWGRSVFLLPLSERERERESFLALFFFPARSLLLGNDEDASLCCLDLLQNATYTVTL